MRSNVGFAVMASAFLITSPALADNWFPAYSTYDECMWNNLYVGAHAGGLGETVIGFFLFLKREHLPALTPAQYLAGKSVYCINSVHLLLARKFPIRNWMTSTEPRSAPTQALLVTTVSTISFL
jgi:uncharacterized membrane protein YedE/YeeE